MKILAYIVIHYIVALLFIMTSMFSLFGLFYSPFLASYSLLLIVIITLLYWSGDRFDLINSKKIFGTIRLSLIEVTSILLVSILLVSLMFFLAADNTFNISRELFLKFSSYIYLLDSNLNSFMITGFLIIFVLILFLIYLNGKDNNYKKILILKSNLSKILLSIGFISHILFVGSAGLKSSDADELNNYAVDYLQLHYKKLEILSKKYKSYEIIEEHLEVFSPSDLLENIISDFPESSVSRSVVYEYHYRKGRKSVSGETVKNVKFPIINNEEPLVNLQKVKVIENKIKSLELLIDAKKDIVNTLAKALMPEELSLSITALIEGISDAISSKISVSSWPLSLNDIVALEIWWSEIQFSTNHNVDWIWLNEKPDGEWVRYQIKQLDFEEGWNINCVSPFSAISMNKYKYNCYSDKYKKESFGFERTAIYAPKFDPKHTFEKKHFPKPYGADTKFTWDKFFKTLAKSI